MSAQIQYVPSFMPIDIANDIYSHMLENDANFINYGNAEQEFKVYTATEMQEHDSIMLPIMQEYSRKVHEYILNNFDGPFNDFNAGQTHVARFEPGAGMHEHFDSSKPNDIATLIYLNDNYEGGEIYFPDYGISFKPKPGDLLCFPDNPDFVHGVNPLSGSIRYTVPRWFTRIV